MDQRSQLDRQPEPDMPKRELASLSLGLMLGVGIITGALIGALVGHFLLDNVFGWGQDIAVGAIAGAVLGALLSVVGVKIFTASVANSNR